MIDFDKLNAMVNEVNNVISDVERETIEYKKKKDIKDMEIFNKMLIDLKEVFAILKKTHCKNEWETAIRTNDIIFKFKYKAGNLAFNATESVYILRQKYDGMNYDLGRVYQIQNGDYYNYIKNCRTLDFFMSIAKEWDTKYKSDFETDLCKKVQDILTLRTEKIHREYIEVKEAVENEI